jgi:hypothetical protein
MNRRERRATVKQSPLSALVHTVRDGFACANSGHRLAVIRPKNPAVTQAIAQAALRHQDPALIEDPPGDDYTFVGWLSGDGRLCLDEQGAPVGVPEPGDSFVTFKNGRGSPSVRSIVSSSGTQEIVGDHVPVVNDYGFVRIVHHRPHIDDRPMIRAPLRCSDVEHGTDSREERQPCPVDGLAHKKQA